MPLERTNGTELKISCPVAKALLDVQQGTIVYWWKLFSIDIVRASHGGIYLRDLVISEWCTLGSLAGAVKVCGREYSKS